MNKYLLEAHEKVYDNLVITLESLADLNLEEVIHEMYNLYQTPIQKGNYNRGINT
ncbi:hypothetical protein [Ochrovirga pacifica]|uniref:hypothetical protein n=1 Tax=Ochrovirga pacifica TaxID=1042376 RepID=UPI0002557FFA|nr:hypothetical protein [Ochrovirga pacifica]